jgi:hypothetical protein
MGMTIQKDGEEMIEFDPEIEELMGDGTLKNALKAALAQHGVNTDDMGFDVESVYGITSNNSASIQVHPFTLTAGDASYTFSFRPLTFEGGNNNENPANNNGANNGANNNNAGNTDPANIGNLTGGKRRRRLTHKRKRAASKRTRRSRSGR